MLYDIIKRDKQMLIEYNVIYYLFPLKCVLASRGRPKASELSNKSEFMREWSLHHVRWQLGVLLSIKGRSELLLLALSYPCCVSQRRDIQFMFVEIRYTYNRRNGIPLEFQAGQNSQCRKYENEKKITQTKSSERVEWRDGNRRPRRFSKGLWQWLISHTSLAGIN